jgi:hypothetical protein
MPTPTNDLDESTRMGNDAIMYICLSILVQIPHASSRSFWFGLPLLIPPKRFKKRVRIPPFAGKLTHDRESSVRQQLFKSSVASRSPYTAGRE